jgi:anti-anti-sigma factor
MTVLAIEGELSVYTAPALKARLLDALAEAGAGDLMLDLQAVSEVDGAGIQLLLAARREAALRGSKLALCNPTPVFAEAVALAGLAAELGPEDTR